jgi:hypothetical protein
LIAFGLGWKPRAAELLGCNPDGERRVVDFDPFAGEGRALAVQRQTVAELANLAHGDRAWAGKIARTGRGIAAIAKAYFARRHGQTVQPLALLDGGDGGRDDPRKRGVARQVEPPCPIARALDPAAVDDADRSPKALCATRLGGVSQPLLA